MAVLKHEWSGLIVSSLLRLYLTYSALGNRFNYKVNRAMALGSMRTLLVKIKTVVKVGQ